VNLDRVEKIAEAVLYEGYMLYPYRPSAIKNQQRWNFGVLYPPPGPSDPARPGPCSMQTECLLRTTASTELTVKVRFLQIVQRSIGKFRTPEEETRADHEPDLDYVDRLELAGRVYQPWQEALEREITCDLLRPESLASSLSPFAFPAGKTCEYLRDENGQAVGAIVRGWKALEGTVEIRSNRCHEALFKIGVHIHNQVPLHSLETAPRDEILLSALVSTHTVLGVEHGAFVSLLDPPDDLINLAAQCINIGTWPVLVADGAATVLSSPIILYDYPQIAPESAGNLFDSTEIDEILSLRILTLTDAEKREMRQSDDRTRAILERTENLPEEQFMKLHGVLRGLTGLTEERL
jgi:hypothetical protein